jgi:DNA replication and repair protein RecF
MFLSSLHLRNFRNFAEQRLELPPEGVAIVGDNGQGKTNLLEAIYYLEIFRSFRGASDEQLVRFGEEVFRVEARVGATDGSTRSVAAAFDRRARKKRVTVGGAEPARLGDAIGVVGVVVFSPSDVEIVAGSPTARRRFVDILLSLVVPGYVSTLQRYRQILQQRNSLLRQGARPSMVEAWNGGLVAEGSRIMAARRRWIEEREAAFGERSAEISGGAPYRLHYEPSVADDQAADPADLPAAGFARAFAAQLERVAEREQRRGVTLAGPHRDDLRITAEVGGREVDLRAYGSGGQQRTAAVALRMIEAETLQASRERKPIVLLDDVFAELDPGRSQRIVRWIDRADTGQVILTVPKPTDFEIHGHTLPRWTIRDGVVRQA